MKRFKNKHGLIGIDDKPVRVPLKVVDGEVKEWGEETHDLFNALLINAPVKTQNDSIQGGRMYQALKAGEEKEFIELEEGVHDWFKPVAEALTPQVFRFNGNIVYEFIKEGFEKKNQPQSKDKE